MATAAELEHGDRARGCLCVLCGLPAAGKSSLSRSICLAAGRQGWRAAVLQYDELIPDQAFHAREGLPDEETTSQESRTDWKFHRNAVLKSIEQFLEKQEITLKPLGNGSIDGPTWEHTVSAPLTLEHTRADTEPLLFLLDDNFYYPSMRYEVFQLARKYSLGFCQVYAQCAVELCLSRNENRPGPVTAEVIMEMAKRLESPNSKKNQWEAKSVTVDTSENVSECEIQKVMELISSALSEPLSPVEEDEEFKEADRQRCAASIIHQADQACRRLISETMKKAKETGVSCQNMRSLATHLNESKAQFLQKLRAQVLQNPNLYQEAMDVDHVVKTALARFDTERQEILLKIFQNHLII
ncbi:L-seryl-tRNA(Sec) kinase [Corythoichthys intestinalis]|uniref:L-seryl-tRNA(Sec) kinase n=1 Tax=Corythoichthys intestinalis TaxID=161448 RepID=UPI0025A5F8B9|nr:L-seryl-tRNA(Sec) kinase [Corythoichthys intestinalis]XP_061807404.1 L-seryl-tRNA(Sec) kinase-like [Nerophis lumbriciformis]